MQGTQDIIQMAEIRPILEEDDLLQRFRANIYSLSIEQIRQLSEMIEDEWSSDYIAELDSEDRQNLLMQLRTRQTELLMQSVASLERQKENFKVQIQIFLAENLKMLEKACAKCFYKNFDTFFAIFMAIACLVAAIIANWIIQHLVGYKINSQTVLIIIGIGLLLCVFFICCINDNHSHQGAHEPQNVPANPRNRRIRRNQEGQRRWKSMIQRSEADQCLELLINGPREEFQRIPINHIPYLRNLIIFSHYIRYPERIKCVILLDQIHLERYRQWNQRLQREVTTLEKRLNTLSTQRTKNMQCELCWPCRLTSHTSIFCSLSGLVAIGITEVTAFSSSPLTTEWSPTWAIKIMLIILILLLAFQIGYRNFRSKNPFIHKFF